MPKPLMSTSLGHFQVGSYRYRSLTEGLFFLLEALLPTCSFL